MARYKLEVNVQTESKDHSLVEQRRLYDALEADIQNGNTSVDMPASIYISSLARVKRWPPMGPWPFIMGVWFVIYTAIGDWPAAGFMALMLAVIFGVAYRIYRKNSNWRTE